MEHHANQHYHPNPDAPKSAVTARNQFKSEAPCYEYIDEEEPDIACKSVQQAAPKGLLTGHTGQLAVGTVQEVGKHEHAYAKQGPAHCWMPPAESCESTQENGNDCNYVGMYPEMAECLGEQQSDGTCKPYIQPLFGIL